MDRAEADIWYPGVRDVLTVHADIVEEDPDATPGVQDEERIEFAIDYVKEGHFGEVPSTIHEKAFHLMRLIASNHWFADANKRTALNTTELFYRVNGYELDYGDDLRSMLKLFSVREELIDKAAGPKYLRDKTTERELEGSEVVSRLFTLLTILVAAFLEKDPKEMICDLEVDIDVDVDIGTESIRDVLGLTTQYGTTVNIGEKEMETDDGG